MWTTEAWSMGAAARSSRILAWVVAGAGVFGLSGEVRGAQAEWDEFPVVAEVDASSQAPVYEYPAQGSRVTNLLGKAARLLPMGEQPRMMAWVLGKEAGLKPGGAYLLSIEFPDDRPRSILVANRGADLVRGFATGGATGDARQQYTQPSLESLNYPQTRTWQRYRMLFVLHDRFQGLKAQRDPQPGGRPFTPKDGFHVLIFQTHHLNDARSEGAAIGTMRLHAVPDLRSLAPRIEFPPRDLPRRHVFFREEMGDEPISGKNPEDRATADPVEWYVNKARVARALGFNTFTRDLLEFGFNQGWESADWNWSMNAQPPLHDSWDRLVPRLTEEQLELLPYFEYKGAIGLANAQPPSLSWQRRAEKLYHGRPNTNYTGVWWVEQHNADLTDPDTLVDARRLLDTTILRYKSKATFAGAWFRTRGNHLPISFAEAALNRFRQAAQLPPGEVTRDTMITAYEGDRKLYDRYVNWWLDQRVRFLSALQQHLAHGLGTSNACLLFTPWPGEPVPLLRDPKSGTAGHPVQITTDDPAWWEALAKAQPNDSWFRWALMPTLFEAVTKDRIYAQSLAFRPLVGPLPWRTEDYHAAPNADPQNYVNANQVMVTYPAGRLFTVADESLLASYRTQAGLTILHHFTLNEDNPADTAHKGPFGGLAGYVCVDVDRAGPHVLLQETRAVALADPTQIGFLCGSGYSTGFPDQVRRFNQAFLALPALPSVCLPGAASDREVVVREIRTAGHGTWFAVANTAFTTKRSVKVALPTKAPVRDLVEGRDLGSPQLVLDLEAGELRSYRARLTGW